MKPVNTKTITQMSCSPALNIESSGTLMRAQITENRVGDEEQEEYDEQRLHHRSFP
jgi:hypothetical protein